MALKIKPKKPSTEAGFIKKIFKKKHEMAREAREKSIENCITAVEREKALLKKQLEEFQEMLGKGHKKYGVRTVLYPFPKKVGKLAYSRADLEERIRMWQGSLTEVEKIWNNIQGATTFKDVEEQYKKFEKIIQDLKKFYAKQVKGK